MKLKTIIVNFTLVTILSTITVVSCSLYNSHPYSPSNTDVQNIYNKVLAATGQLQEGVPLVIEDNDEINAFSDGENVVIYTGIIKFAKSPDEIALVLGHELAHNMLHHFKILKHRTTTTYDVLIAEALADKLGAFYTMKAGYSVCKARDMWRRLMLYPGDALGQDHPDFAYRWCELNVGCDN